MDELARQFAKVTLVFGLFSPERLNRTVDFYVRYLDFEKTDERRRAPSVDTLLVLRRTGIFQILLKCYDTDASISNVYRGPHAIRFSIQEPWKLVDRLKRDGVSVQTFETRTNYFATFEDPIGNEVTVES